MSQTCEKSMFTVRFREVYSRKQRIINEKSPEILFMKGICTGNAKAEEYFTETTMYRQRTFLDAPNGRFEGLAGIQQFADRWLDDFQAKDATVYPVIQTVANGRAVTEMEVWFNLKNGESKRVPMVVFADLMTKTIIEGMRIYFFFKFLPNAVAYRKPIFRPSLNKPANPVLMTGVMRYYYEQLHNFRPEALDNIMDMCSDHILYGGYRPDEEEPLAEGKKDLRKAYEGICKMIPHKKYIRFETFTDDGLNMAVEWTIVARQSALAEGEVSVAGCAMYERDEDGKMGSIRICDNVGYDLGIDLNSIPQSDMFID